jgi:hypothetical protein
MPIQDLEIKGISLIAHFFKFKHKVKLIIIKALRFLPEQRLISGVVTLQTVGSLRALLTLILIPIIDSEFPSK